MTIYSLYLITNLSNNKTYVGWTSRDPHLRFIEHQKTHKPKYQSRSAISYAIEKYGHDNFLFEVLTKTTDQQYSKSLESFYVAWYGSLIDVWGYNKDFGGTGHKRTAETIEKHRQKLLGRKQTEEHIKKRIKPKKEKVVLSEEEKELRRLAGIEKMKSTKKEQASKGELWMQSDEGRKHMSESAMGRKQTDKQKEIARECNSKEWIITDPLGNEFIIKNLRKFALENGLDQGNLVSVAKGRLKQHKGYKVKSK